MGECGLPHSMAAGFEGRCPMSKNQESSHKATLPHSPIKAVTRSQPESSRREKRPALQRQQPQIFWLPVPGIFTTSFQCHKGNHPHSAHHYDDSPGGVSRAALSLSHR